MKSRVLIASLLIIPMYIACDVVEPGADGTTVAGEGVRFMTTGGDIEIATVDTVFENDEVVQHGHSTEPKNTTDWIWHADLLADEDEDSVVIHYTVNTGEIDLEHFEGRYDTLAERTGEAWSDLSILEARTLATDEGVRIMLRKP